MKSTIEGAVAAELGLRPQQATAVAKLLDAGATIPFIARYRKEATGGLDEVAVTTVRDLRLALREFEQRRQTVLKSLEKNGHLTPELEEKVRAASSPAALEDIYLPYRPKRRTRAGRAREKGLEPLALTLLEQVGRDPAAEAAAYVVSSKGVDCVEAALAGARDIIAERISEDEPARAAMRDLFSREGLIQSRVAADCGKEGEKYRNYFEWTEPVRSVPSHRILAMRRGEKEGALNLSLAPPESRALTLLKTLFVTGQGADAAEVTKAMQDGYKRLLSRAMETELRIAAKERADTEAIKVFASNLRQLLLAPVLGPKRVMGIDPGFKSGCKLACLDRQGKLLQHATVYPHGSASRAETARQTLVSLCETCRVEAIAVGNGTAGRETEAFIRALPLAPDVCVVMVDESGASVYSASELARREFPELSLTIRGAVSIGRRLMDPLAELVKIDPKSIGVGQYQHDVDPSRLRQTLDDVVVSCVNSVGVDLNRASVELLTYVSGLGPQLASNIVAFRNANGPFETREQLRQVPRLGPKAFEQSAGFLRIRDGSNPLDASAVHPERYSLVETMARDLDCTVADLIHDRRLRQGIDLSRYLRDDVGWPTLRDIVAELDKPGRDPREKFERFRFAENVARIEDLQPGMRLPGIVTNITAFGAFVDIGVHQDGLVHISELSHRFVKNPGDVVTLRQKVQVTVLAVDLQRKRIALSMKVQPAADTFRVSESGAKTGARCTAGASGGGAAAGRKRPLHSFFKDLLAS